MVNFRTRISKMMDSGAPLEWAFSIPLLEEASLSVWVRRGSAKLRQPRRPPIPDGMSVLDALVNDFALLTTGGLAELQRQVQKQLQDSANSM
jgi:hypothetical protein